MIREKILAEETGKQYKKVMQAIRNMEPAWMKICGRNFALTSETWSGLGGIAELKFQLGGSRVLSHSTILLMHFIVFQSKI